MEGPLEDVVVRRATAADAAAIAHVHVASWREAHAGVVPPSSLAAWDVSERTDYWAQLLTGARTDTWLAMAVGRVVGFAALGESTDEDADRSTLELSALYLDPEVWGKGVARNLMRTLLADVDAHSTVTLWVVAENDRAQRFYRRHGFARDGVERRQEIGGTDLLEVRYRRG